MVNDEIIVPIIGIPFYRKGKFGVADALDDCLKAGYRPLYMPELVDTKIAASKGNIIWRNWHITPSIKATGRGTSSNVSHKGGTEFVVICHFPNFYSDPKKIRKVVKNDELIKGAGIIPSKKFQEYLDREDGERDFVIPNSDLKPWPSGIYGIDEPTKEHMREFRGKIGGKDMIAINHPMTKAFLTPKKAELYLGKHKQVYGDKIGIWCTDDLQGKPLGRLLVVGSNYYGLLGDDSLNGVGRFVGVSGGTEGAAKIAGPTKE